MNNLSPNHNSNTGRRPAPAWGSDSPFDMPEGTFEESTVHADDGHGYGESTYESHSGRTTAGVIPPQARITIDPDLETRLTVRSPFASARYRTDTWKATWYRVGQIEGPRGKAIRLSVALRYLGYLATIIGCSAVSHVVMAGTKYSSGGTIMLFSAALMAVTAAAGTMFMPHKREELIHEYRKYTFQMAVLPGAAMALVMRITNSYTATPTNGDAFGSLLSSTLPLMYVFTVLVPAVIFVKAVVGFRSLDRNQQDDEEQMLTWTRQDYMMR